MIEDTEFTFEKAYLKENYDGIAFVVGEIYRHASMTNITYEKNVFFGDFSNVCLHADQAYRSY